MDRQFEKSYERLFLYMVIAVRLYAKRSKDSGIPIMEEWLVKITEFAEMVKLTYLIRKKTTIVFISDWKPFMDFLLKTGKNNL